MWRIRVLAYALVTGLLASRAGAQTPVLIGFVDSDTRFAVRGAVEGAAARLARRGCQDVLSDFTDESGQNLATGLETSGRSPAEAFGLLRFFDDRGAAQCHAGTTLAFTQTGSSLIRVCGREFRDRSMRNRMTTEIIVIHEFLHALGLGENPPTSQTITERVAVRCGG